jgi:hypothetical protein
MLGKKIRLSHRERGEGEKGLGVDDITDLKGK